MQLMLTQSASRHKHDVAADHVRVAAKIDAWYVPTAVAPGAAAWALNQPGGGHVLVSAGGDVLAVLRGVESRQLMAKRPVVATPR